MHTIAPTTLGLTLALAASGVQAADVRVTLDNLKPDTGHLMVALYDSAQGFSEDKGAVEAIRKPVKGDSLVITFTGIDDGEYAIAVFQDVNGDGELDTNLLGMPREPWGFSLDADGGMGPPDFTDAAFTVDGETVDMRIRLNRP